MIKFNIGGQVGQGRFLIRMIINLPSIKQAQPVVILFELLLMGLYSAGCQSVQPLNVSTPTSAPTITAMDPITTTVRLANGEWVPYTGENLPQYGCDSQVVTEAFALEGITVEYDFFPWARSYYLSESGAWDGTIEWADTPAHRETHYISAAYLSKQKWVFFYRRDRPFEWNSMDDLAGKVVGLTIGYAYSDVFEALKQKGTVSFEEAPSDELNFKKLLAGHIDVFPVERTVGYAVMMANLTVEEQAQITEHPKPISEYLTYLLLSRAVPQNEQRMELFNRGLRHLRESWRYAEIMETCTF